MICIFKFNVGKIAKVDKTAQQYEYFSLIGNTTAPLCK